MMMMVMMLRATLLTLCLASSIQEGSGQRLGKSSSVSISNRDEEDSVTPFPSTNVPATMDPSDELETGSPSETASPSETVAPTQDDETDEVVYLNLVGHCDDQRSYGTLQENECFAVDDAYCTWNSPTTGCREVLANATYYNAIWDEADGWRSTNYSYYADVGIFTNTCWGADTCEVHVDGYACNATCAGHDITVWDCHDLPLDATMQFRYFPQTINAEHGIFHMESNDEMCDHPSAIDQLENEVVRSAPGTGGTTKSGRAKIYTIPTELTLTFNDAQDLDLNLDVPTRTHFLVRTMDFFMSTLTETDPFVQSIQDVSVGGVEVTVGTDDQVTVSFDTKVIVDAAATATLRQAMYAMAEADWWGDFIAPFRQAGPQGQEVSEVLSNLHQVHYRGVGDGSLTIP